MDSSKFPTPMLSISSTEPENINQKLLKAVKNGNLKEVKRLLKKGASPLQKGIEDENGHNILMAAIEGRHVDIIKELIKKKATACITFAARNHKTPMMLAAEKGFDEILQLFLLPRRKKPMHAKHLNATTSDLLTAFDVACLNNHVSTMKILADAGANAINTKLMMKLIHECNVTMVIILVQQYHYDTSTISPIVFIHGAGYHKNDAIMNGIILSAMHGEKKLVNIFIGLYHDITFEQEKLNSTIQYAVEAGWVDIVRLLIPYISNINFITQDNSSSLLALAVKLNKAAVAIELIRAKASCDSLPYGGSIKQVITETALLGNEGLMLQLFNTLKMQGSKEVDAYHEFANQAFICAVKLKDNSRGLYFISHGAYLDYVNPQGENGFILACQYNLNILIPLGFALLANTKKQLPQHLLEAGFLMACQHGSTEVVDFLIKKVDLQCFDENGCTPIMLASKNGHTDIVGKLIKAESFLNKLNHSGENAFMLAVENNYEAVTELLLPGTDVLQMTPKGQTLLMCTARMGFFQATKKLLEGYFCKVHHTCNKGLNALMEASIAGHAKIVSLLINAGINIEARDLNDKTAFMYALEHKRASVMGALIRGGAAFEFKNKNFNFIFENSAKAFQDEIIELLFEALSEQNYIKIKPLNEAFKLAVSCNMSELIAPFIDLGADPHYRNDEDYPLIFSCIENQNLNSFNLLLKRGITTDIVAGNGMTLLYACANIGNLFMVKKLLEINPGLIDIPCHSGHRPVFIAAMEDHAEVVEYLLTHGKSAYLVKSFHNETLIHFAASYGSFRTVELLIKLKVDVDLLSDDHLTPLMCAVTTDQCKSERAGDLVRTVDVLIKSGANIQLLAPDGRNIVMLASDHDQKNVMARLLCAMPLKAIDLFLHDHPSYTADTQAIFKMVSNAQKSVLSILGSMWPANSKESSPFLSLPMELRAKVLAHSYSVPWYENRKSFDINLAVQKINEMIENRKIAEKKNAPPAIIFSTPSKRKHEDTDEIDDSRSSENESDIDTPTITVSKKTTLRPILYMFSNTTKRKHEDTEAEKNPFKKQRTLENKGNDDSRSDEREIDMDTPTITASKKTILRPDS